MDRASTPPGSSSPRRDTRSSRVLSELLGESVRSATRRRLVIQPFASREYTQGLHEYPEVVADERPAGEGAALLDVDEIEIRVARASDTFRHLRWAGEAGHDVQPVVESVRD